MYKVNGNTECYGCFSKDNLRICSKDYAICQGCYQQQVNNLREYKKTKILQPQINEIVEGLYLGNEDAAVSLKILEQREITAILACGSLLQTPFIQDTKYTYKKLEIDDYPNQNIKQYFEEIYNWISERRKENRKILIHCAAGISRSSSFTIAYFMKEKNIPYLQAHHLVKKKRNCICPNIGFSTQLKQYQQELKIEDKDMIY